MGARKMSYSALKNNNDTRLDEALSKSTPSPLQRSTNRKSMTPNDIRIDDDFAELFSTDSALIDEIAKSMGEEGYNPNRPLDRLCQYLFAISVKKATELCRLFLQFKALFQERLKP